MHDSKCPIAAALALMMGLGSMACSQQSQGSNAATDGLSPDQRVILQKAGMPVAVPMPIPPGFEPVNVSVLTDNPDDPFSGGYVIVYRQVEAAPGAQACFEVEGAKGGFGGPSPEFQMAANLPTFAQSLADAEDYVYQMFWSDGEGEMGPFPSPILFSDWIQADQGYYRVASLTANEPDCARLDPETANQILGSLEYID